MKKLPLGIQTFKEIIQEGYLYVDKTRFIYDIAANGKNYFLSRPRRFGKSLTLSTLASIFKGEKELFEGLYIYDQPWEWKKWPVLRFDLSEFSEEKDEDDLKLFIKRSLRQKAEAFGIQVNESLPYDEYFANLLALLPERAVVLIDEYDKPILNNITKPKKAEKAKEILKGFYTILKARDENLRFTFLTGVTKFAKISVFSGLNNLTDLTMKPAFADLCGYTEEELDRYFGSALHQIADRKEIREWYNGFRFSSRDLRVYNPVSIFTFLQDREFKPYWFETGTPTFLAELMKKEDFPPTDLENLICSESDFSTYDVENLRALPILFQSGYLTIGNYDPSMEAYYLTQPNREVRQAFANSLLRDFAPVTSTTPLHRLTLAIKSGDLELFFENLEILFAQVPYDVHLKYEKYWQSLFYLIFVLMGYHLELEYRTSRGRIDAVFTLPDRVYLFEFKFTDQEDKDQILEEAKRQIRETDYAKRFLGGEKPVVALPVVFEYQDAKAVVVWEEMEGTPVRSE
jgi:hypothetical protein